MSDSFIGERYMFRRSLPPACIAFDAEGTLFSVEDYQFRAHADAASVEQGFTITPKEIREIPGAIGGGDSFIAKRLSTLSGGAINPEAHLILKNELFDRLFEASPLIEPRRGVREVLETVQRAGIPFAIGSITKRDRLLKFLECTRLRHFFPENRIVTLEKIQNGRPKPEPDLFLATAQELGFDSAAQIVFEDSTPGIEAAWASSSWPIAMPFFTHKEHCVRLIECGAIRLFHCWTELNILALIQNLRDQK